MKLSDLFRGRSDSEIVISQKNLNMLKLNRQIRTLAPGHTIQGEVISKKGNEVQIKLADDLVLTARLERELSIDIGKILTFEVRNNGKALTLSPLFANTANDPNVLKALDMANIPANETTMEMTQIMMEQGMPVDKNHLQSVYRDVVSHMDASLRDIVQLHQLGVEVSSEALNQLTNYQSAHHQMTEGMNQILMELEIGIDSLIQTGKADVALELLRKLSSIFNEQSTELTDVSETIPNVETVAKNAGQSVENAKTVVSSEEIRTVPGVEVLPDAPKGSDLTFQEGSVLQTIFTGKEGETLKNVLQQYAISQNDEALQTVLQKMESGTATVKEVIEHLGGKAFVDILKEQALKSWLLTPDEVSNKENVEKLYFRIQRQLTELGRVLSETSGLETTTAMKSVTNLQNNLDFMNQLNQIFTYVQLPLQMSGKETHGELYVYTNKRNLSREDGNISAYLHLDMEHLGPVTVYVAMQNQKVNTKFYLKDDEMIDFIQAHIHLLNERLKKRGYSMKCEMMVKNPEEEISIIERIVESDKNVSVLSRYAFDVRA